MLKRKKKDEMKFNIVDNHYQYKKLVRQCNDVMKMYLFKHFRISESSYEKSCTNEREITTGIYLQLVDAYSKITRVFSRWLPKI